DVAAARAACQRLKLEPPVEGKTRLFSGDASKRDSSDSNPQFTGPPPAGSHSILCGKKAQKNLHECTAALRVLTFADVSVCAQRLTCTHE
ncbi:MAG: hypothetical protein O3A00_24270, partial [Planctomycetota bacterium]|nr:hypothetical protein [Planctomycetota bacterium]